MITSHTPSVHMAQHWAVASNWLWVLAPGWQT